ncbi:hypothetical protein, partial [Streptococcus phage phi-SsuYTJ2_rum]
QNP